MPPDPITLIPTACLLRVRGDKVITWREETYEEQLRRRNWEWDRLDQRDSSMFGSRKDPQGIRPKL